MNQRLQLLQSMNADPRWRSVSFAVKAQAIDEILKCVAFGPRLHVGPGPDPRLHAPACSIWRAGGACDCGGQAYPPEPAK